MHGSINCLQKDATVMFEDIAYISNPIADIIDIETIQ
jgi:hypothetical protein